MFKKKTFTEIWNEKIIVKEKEANTKLKIYMKKAKRVEDIVISQFKESKKIIGDKLSMEKLHESMFKFYFGSGKDGYYSVTLHSSDVEANGIYNLYHYCPINRNLDKFNINIKLKELSQRLIQYTRLVLKTRGIIV